MAKSIMVQGTMSNAGKSLLVGGLCRIFAKDGYKAAPFKSQNMSLNSYITTRGLEMGRAQVMQAEAAGIEPDARMNPVLLKPTDDTRSQVIVNGKVRGMMSAQDYYRNKKKLVPEILESYESLAGEYDIIVLEGAGSPAEINLNKDDIVNMGMAKMAKAPVLLVGDIDRGGVFAQLIGTIMLLDPSECSYIKGLVINKFRGDINILKPGLDMLEKRSGKKVIGVIPYLDIDIDEEDSLTERFAKKNIPGDVDIAVIRLPHISNFTDFAPFECLSGVSLRYIGKLPELGNPDIIIIPGTKNTIGDMLWMRECGLEAKILHCASCGKIIFGICGGYQMLGEKIIDKSGVEHTGETRGMCLLPAVTRFEGNKTTDRVRGKVTNAGGALSCLNGTSFSGYEIHNGISILTEEKAFTQLTLDGSGAQKPDGTCRGNVYGTYVHGFFDSEAIVRKIISEVMRRKGLDSSGMHTVNMSSYKQQQYDLLGNAVRKSLDMKRIYEILERGIK